MADRVDCTLLIMGKISGPQWQEIENVITEEMDPDEYPNIGEFYCHQVAWGRLHSRVEEILKAADLSFIWMVEGHMDWSPYLEVFDAETKEEASYRREEFNLLLTFEEIRDEEKLAEATRWQQFIYNWKGLNIVS